MKTIRQYYTVITMIISWISANEITLTEYLNKVIKTSYERVELGLQTNEIEAQKRQFMMDYLPSVSYSLNSSQSQQGPREVFVGSVPISQPATDYEYHSTSLNLSKQIFDWGNSFRKKKSLSLKENLTKTDYKYQTRLLIEQIIPFYFQLSEAIEIHEILKQELSDAQKQKTYLDELVNRGVKPPTDQIRLDVSVNELLSKINSQKMTILQLQAEMAFQMDEPLDTTLTPVSATPAFEENNINNKTNSVYWRLDYLTKQIQLNETELSILKWDRLPDLYFSAGYSRGNTLFESLYTDFENDWNMNYSLSLSFPLFQNDKHHLQETQKRIQIQRLKRQLIDEKKKIDKHKTLLQQQIQSDQQHIKLKEENIRYYESIYTHELERYNSGLIEFQILKDTRNSLMQNKQSLIAIKHKLMINQEKLKLQMGERDIVFMPALPK